MISDSSEPKRRIKHMKITCNKAPKSTIWLCVERNSAWIGTSEVRSWHLAELSKYLCKQHRLCPSAHLKCRRRRSTKVLSIPPPPPPPSLPSLILLWVSWLMHRQACPFLVMLAVKYNFLRVLLHPSTEFLPNTARVSQNVSLQLDKKRATLRPGVHSPGQVTS